MVPLFWGRNSLGENFGQKSDPKLVPFGIRGGDSILCKQSDQTHFNLCSAHHSKANARFRLNIRRGGALRKYCSAWNCIVCLFMLSQQIRTLEVLVDETFQYSWCHPSPNIMISKAGISRWEWQIAFCSALQEHVLKLINIIAHIFWI